MLRSLFAKRNATKGHTESFSQPIEPFDERQIARLASIDTFSGAEPFPHLVIDDLFDPAALDRVLDEWPTPDDPGMRSFHDGTYVKLKYASTDRSRLGPYTRFFVGCLAEPKFLEALEKVTGISGLIPDPYLRGGGLHFTRAGGTLAVHADFNRHFKFDLDRRLNLILYLNRGWTEDNQGWLELWDRDMKLAVQRILPVFNRTVVFATMDFSLSRTARADQRFARSISRIDCALLLLERKAYGRTIESRPTGNALARTSGKGLLSSLWSAGRPAPVHTE